MKPTGKSFLFTAWEGGGNVPPVLAVARKLKAEGHHVRVMSDACNRPETEAAGAQFIAWTTAPSRQGKSAADDLVRDWEPEDPMEGMGRVFEHVMFGPAAAYARDVTAEIARQRPDAVISNEMLFGAMAAAEASRIPLALFCPNTPLFPVEGVPPFGPGLLPPRSVEERAQHAEIAAASAALFNRGLPALNAARAALDLAPVAHVFDQCARANATLFGTARCFDFAPDALPANMHYVGPQLLLETAPAAPWASPWPKEDSRPLAVLSFSTTFQNQGPAIQRAIDALAGLPLRLLVTLGPALDPRDFKTADNVALVRRAPHGVVMGEAALTIAHGGHGTVMTALIHDCPLLVMAMGRDQNDNAVRVTSRNAGLALDPKTATTAQIREAVLRLLEEPRFARAAAELGANIRQEAQASAIVEILEALARPIAAAA